jgi:hypothetical protein
MDHEINPDLAAELTSQGPQISADTVADMLREDGFSLQGNAKTLEGKQHPDRDGSSRISTNRPAPTATPASR